MLRKVLGVSLIGTPFFGLLIAMIYAYGMMPTAIIAGVATLMAAMIIGGVHLIFGY